MGPEIFNPNPKAEERRKSLTAKAFSFAEQKRVLHSASLKHQGIWLKWSENTIPFDFSWKNLIWSSNSQVIKCVLSSSINWVKPKIFCNCGALRIQAQRHTTSYFAKLPRYIEQQRYTWRHDSVLLHLTTALEALVQAWNVKNDTTQSVPTINFVKAGAKDTKCTKPVLTPSLLQGASDWKLLVDFGQDQVTFPSKILSTNERPDIVFWSVKARKVILIELTCPAEEGISAAQDRKQARYLSLISQIQERKWTVKFLTIEVGVRGFVGNSLFKCLISLGFSRSATTKLCKTVSLVSAKCSYTIFLSSGSRNWDTGRVLLGPDVI